MTVSRLYSFLRAPQKNAQQGMSLIALLVAVAVSGILAVVIAQRLTNENDSQRDLQNKIDRLALRRFVLNAIDCDATTANIPKSCTPGTFVEVRSSSTRKPTLITRGNKTKIGNFRLRARCAPCSSCPGGRMLKVEAIQVTKAGAPAKSPLTGKVTGWEDLNKTVPLACVLP